MQREDRATLFEAQKQAIKDQNAAHKDGMLEKADPGTLALFTCSLAEAIALGELAS